MREALTDLLTIASAGGVQTMRVNGSESETIIDGMTDMMFFQADLKKPVLDLQGQFGITNMSLLRGLLSFPSYIAEGSKFKVEHFEHNGEKIPVKLVFNGKNASKALFSLANPKHVPPQLERQDFKVAMKFSPNKGKLAEFKDMTGIAKEFSGDIFTTKVVDANLLFEIGEESATTHFLSMVIEENVDGSIPDGMIWPLGKFHDLVKAIGGNPFTVEIVVGTRLMIFSFDNEYAKYRYLMRGLTPTK